MSEHYTDGRRYSHISNAWILLSSWNDKEEIAYLENRVAELDLDGSRWRTFKRLNNGGSWDMRRFLFDENGQNGKWVWVQRHEMDKSIDAETVETAVHPS